MCYTLRDSAHIFTNSVCISKYKKFAVRFDFKPSERILNCLREVFRWHGTKWIAAISTMSDDAVLKLADRLSRDGWVRSETTYGNAAAIQ